MFSENKKISGRQIFRLLSYDLIGVSTLLLPTVLSMTAGVDGIFCIVIGLVAGCIYLKVLTTLAQQIKVDFFTYLKETCGICLQKLILLFFLVHFVLLSGFTAYLFTTLVLKNLLEQESFLMVLILLLVVAGYGTLAGIEGRARIYEMLFWIIMIPLFLMLFSAARDVEPDYWTPLWMGSQKSFLQGCYVVLIWVSLIFLILFLVPFAKSHTALLQNGRRSLLFAGGLNLILYLILLGTFGANALSRMDHPVVTLMSTVQMTGGFFKRADALMFGVWFFTLFALLNSMLFYGAKTMQSIFYEIQFLPCFLSAKDKEGESENTNRTKNKGVQEKWYAGVLMLLTFVIAIIFYRQGEAQELYRWWIWRVATPILLLLPIVLLGISKGKEAWKK